SSASCVEKGTSVPTKRTGMARPSRSLDGPWALRGRGALLVDRCSSQQLTRSRACVTWTKHDSLPAWLTVPALWGACLRWPESRDRQEAGPQEGQARPAIRLALDQLALGDLPF